MIVRSALPFKVLFFVDGLLIVSSVIAAVAVSVPSPFVGDLTPTVTDEPGIDPASGKALIALAAISR